MAPIRSTSLTSATTTAPRKSILKTSNLSNTNKAKPTQPESLFPSSKKDKRKIKHEQLISKITKSATVKTRRRRPSKKLVTTLDALADALPDSGGSGHGSTTVGNDSAGHAVRDQVNVIKRSSMKSKPGAMKRREKIDQGERDRFAKNLAQMTGSAGRGDIDANSKAQAQAPEDRWKALRGFIAQTMEKKPGMGP